MGLYIYIVLSIDKPGPYPEPVDQTRTDTRQYFHKDLRTCGQWNHVSP